MCSLKKQSLQSLEIALGEDVLANLQSKSALSDGSQFRPRVIEQPSRASILKSLQQAGSDLDKDYGPLSARATRSVVINRALEIQQQQSVLHQYYLYVEELTLKQDSIQAKTSKRPPRDR